MGIITRILMLSDQCLSYLIYYIPEPGIGGIHLSQGDSLYSLKVRIFVKLFN